MRNYKKEGEWRKKRYTQICVSIQKELAKKLRKKLEKNKKTITSWMVENIEKYIISKD